MLLNFKVSNYKSFVKKATLSLEPAPKQKGLDYSVHRFKIGAKTYKALCSAVIYGPNAAGKTSLIGAMEAFRNIVLRGNIKDGDGAGFPNKAAYNLSLIPHAFNANAKPVSFSVKFLKNESVFEYSLQIDLGGFLAKKHERKVVKEALAVDGEAVFSRTADDVTIGEGGFAPRISEAFRENQEIAAVFLNDVAPDDLFLTTGFRMLVSPDLSREVIGWFENDLIVVYRANSIEVVPELTDPVGTTPFVVKQLNKAAKIFGISANSVGYMRREGDEDPTLFSLFKKADGSKGGFGIAAEVFESYGTVRFLQLFGIILDALEHGKTLFIDEFDASIHPVALMNLVNIFHNDEINRKGAQLIFNTHNPIFLNHNLFRRDEIKFVEKDAESGESVCYSLSDFGTSGENGVRSTDDYMKNYFIDRYGAIEDVDFSDLIEEILMQRQAADAE